MRSDNENDQKHTGKPDSDSWIGIGIALGTGIGVTIGVVIGAISDNVGMGVAMGVSFGGRSRYSDWSHYQ